MNMRCFLDVATSKRGICFLFDIIWRMFCFSIRFFRFGMVSLCCALYGCCDGGVIGKLENVLLTINLCRGRTQTGAWDYMFFDGSLIEIRIDVEQCIIYGLLTEFYNHNLIQNVYSYQCMKNRGLKQYRAQIANTFFRWNYTQICMSRCSYNLCRDHVWLSLLFYRVFLFI